MEIRVFHYANVPPTDFVRRALFSFITQQKFGYAGPNNIGSYHGCITFHYNCTLRTFSQDNTYYGVLQIYLLDHLSYRIILSRLKSTDLFNARISEVISNGFYKLFARKKISFSRVREYLFKIFKVLQSIIFYANLIAISFAC